ncbi:hypothetical protein NDU88_000528 [Pleurodeles waltl]|uniref:Uncharacterized protein n=1 Tax=Pleurodeles waltl TaxID=8319 RepID=A0AAV7V772_PLEWA|nr:hypothetical protein NDU88_000528 [Pleurodeles waltl]
MAIASASWSFPVTSTSAGTNFDMDARFGRGVSRPCWPRALSARGVALRLRPRTTDVTAIGAAGLIAVRVERESPGCCQSMAWAAGGPLETEAAPQAGAAEPAKLHGTGRPGLAEERRCSLACGSPRGPPTGTTTYLKRLQGMGSWTGLGGPQWCHQDSLPEARCTRESQAGGPGTLALDWATGPGPRGGDGGHRAHSRPAQVITNLHYGKTGSLFDNCRLKTLEQPPLCSPQGLRHQHLTRVANQWGEEGGVV